MTMTTMNSEGRAQRNILINTAQDVWHYLMSITGDEESTFGVAETLMVRIARYELSRTKYIECADAARKMYAAMGIPESQLKIAMSHVDWPLDGMADTAELKSDAHLSREARKAIRRFLAWMEYMQINAYEGREMQCPKCGGASPAQSHVAVCQG